MKMYNRPSLSKEPFAQTLSGKGQGSVEEDPHIAAPVSRLLLSAWNPRSKTGHQRGFRYGVAAVACPPF